jgi:hypothetical protein
MRPSTTSMMRVAARCPFEVVGDQQEAGAALAVDLPAPK